MTEHRFHHPDIGDWVTTGDVSEEERQKYPEGTVEVPMEPVVTAPLTLDQLFARASAIVDAHVDQVAQSRTYKSAESCASYARSSNSIWAAEAAAFIAWRDAVWTHVFALRDQALAGTIVTFPTAEELIASLPQISWPTEGATS